MAFIASDELTRELVVKEDEDCTEGDRYEAVFQGNSKEKGIEVKKEDGDNREMRG